MENKTNKAFYLQIAAMIVAAIMAVLAIFGIGYSTGLFSGVSEVDAGDAVADSNVLIGESKGNGISLTTSLYDKGDHDLTNADTETYTITATITPDDATYKTVTMSVAWVDADSSWASGKTVTDYVTITQTSTGSLTGTLTCLQAFGEQIMLTVAADSNSAIKAEATVDYVARIGAINPSSSTASVNKITFGDSLAIGAGMTVSSYTVRGTVDVNYYLDFHVGDDDNAIANVTVGGWLGNFVTNFFNLNSSDASLYSLYSIKSLDVLSLSRNIESIEFFPNGFSDILQGVFGFTDEEINDSGVQETLAIMTNEYILAFGSVTSINELPVVSVIADYTYSYNGTVYSSGQACISNIGFTTDGLEVAVTGVSTGSSAYVF